jgi:hypothetical protein
MGAITQAMARAASEYGVRIDMRLAVREIIVERGRAAGVVLEDGTPLRARAVIANVDPQQLFQELLPREVVPSAVAERMKRWKAGSGTFRMNVALSKLPAFSALPASGDHHTSGIILAPSLSYMDEACRDCIRHGWSRAPIIEMLIPSTLADTLAPPGAHVASLFCQHVAPHFTDGSTWDQHRETVADLMMDTVEALTLDQLFSARPMLGYANCADERERSDARPPLPPFTAQPRSRKSAWPRTVGTAAIPSACRSPIRPTAIGEIVRSSFRGGPRTGGPGTRLQADQGTLGHHGQP